MKPALFSLAQRVSCLPDFFGTVVNRFCRQENLSAKDILRYLRTTPRMLARLSLCRFPSSSSPEFPVQMQQIAAFTKIDIESLLTILRQVEAVDAFSRQRNILKL